MKLLLITGGRPPYPETTPILSRFLRAAGHTVNVSKSAKELALKTLPGYDAIVLNTRRRPDSDNDLTGPQREGLKSYVENGGGPVSVHISPDSAPEWPEMKKITGGGWTTGKSWHPPFGRMSVHVANRSHPLAKGVSDFETDDELYCDCELQDGLDVFLDGVVEGVTRPLGWSWSYGSGKVANILLGHAGISQSNPNFQQLIRNGVDYVTA